MIKFNMHNVINTETGAKAKVDYNHGKNIDGRECVTVYSKDCLQKLYPVFGKGIKNESDSMTDYFESDSYTIYPENDLFAAAVKACAYRQEARAKRAAAQEAKRIAKYAHLIRKAA